MKGRFLLLCAVLGLAAAPAAAEPGFAGFSPPAACTLGETCWIINYPDVIDAQPGRDYRCGPRSYAHHDGTDFAPADIRSMSVGVPVVAAAPGTVAGMRDGQPDGAYLARGPAAVKGRECGNGVVLRHADGWETQYCHLKRGSVGVRKGETVDRGARLGLIGLSGRAEFPHVHMTVRRAGMKIDPFTGKGLGGGCGETGESLWKKGEEPPYAASSVYAAGLASGIPTAAALKTDTTLPGLPPKPAAELVAWGAVFGLKPGMTLTVELFGPQGDSLAKRDTAVDKPKAWQFSAAGRRAPIGGWPPGRYRAEVTVTEEGKTLSHRSAETEFR
ncbi:M23 family metallopeptidase [Oleispirillum naphthae]|uniref:M23 family metallopeptidase n=1 Tax=Oleispirillum naphthae TaxID=2838853 RepID=UPI0030825CEA